jgi:uracil phosphoribosyltransferase
VSGISAAIEARKAKLRYQIFEATQVFSTVANFPRENRSTLMFRRNLQELAALLLCEAAQNWVIDTIEVETPLKSCDGVLLAKPIVLVPFLSAGPGLLEGMPRVLPEVGIGHIGSYRDDETLRPVSYFSRLLAARSASTNCSALIQMCRLLLGRLI